MNLTIVHVGKYKPDNANGVNKTIVGLCDSLKTYKNYQIEVWNFGKNKNIEEYYIDNIKIINLPKRKINLLNSIFPPIKTSQYLRKRSSEISLFHFHSVFIPINVWLKSFGVKYIITPNGGYSKKVLFGKKKFLKFLWMKFFEKSFVENASAIHAVSDSELSELDKVFRSDKKFVLPNGLENSLVLKNKLMPENKKMIFIGRMAINQKGLDILIESYMNSCERCNGDIYDLYLIGPDFRNNTDMLKKFIINKRYRKKIKFIGPLYGEERFRYFTSINFFVHTSRWEGLPFSLLEALGKGQPALITPETNIANYVKKYNAGIVVNGDIDSVTDALIEIKNLSNEELVKMSKNAVQLISENFLWENITSKLVKEYNK